MNCSEFVRYGRIWCSTVLIIRWLYSPVVRPHFVSGSTFRLYEVQ